MDILITGAAGFVGKNLTAALECIRDGKNILTVENYKNVIKDMYEFAASYSYDQMWVE